MLAIVYLNLQYSDCYCRFISSHHVIVRYNLQMFIVTSQPGITLGWQLHRGTISNLYCLFFKVSFIYQHFTCQIYQHFTCQIYQHFTCQNLRVRIQFRRGVLNEALCDQVCQWLAACRWFSPSTLVSSTNKTDRHNITEILLKVALSGVIHHNCNPTKFKINVL